MKQHRKYVRLMLLSVVLGTAADALSTDYTWNSSVASGGWSVPGNWSSEAYPNSKTDVAKITSAATVSLTEDISVLSFYVNNGSAKHLDLNGHTLTIWSTSAWTGGFRMNQCGGTPTKRGDFLCANGLFAENGTFTMVGSCVLPSDSWSRPYANFSGVALNGGFSEMWYSTRIILRDGSVWTPGVNQGIGGGYYREDKNSANSLVCVTGATSRIEAKDYNLTLRTLGNGLFVLDGAKASWNNIMIGGTFRSTNCIVSVDNATLTVGGEIQLGSDVINPTDSATYKSDINMSYGNELEIGGAAPRVTAERLTVYEGTKTILTVAVPASGYAKAPIEVTNLTSVARNPLYPDSGAGTLRITCQRWAKTHPLESTELMRFETASADALNEITNTVEWVDYTAQQIADGKIPMLSVSSDGKAMLLTAPELNYKPVFTLSTEAGVAIGNKTVKLHVIDYGAESDSLTSIDCEYADNNAFTGAVTTNFLAGLSPVTVSLPCDISYQLAGGLVQHQTYYLRVRATNENGYSFEQTVMINGDPVEETLDWMNGLSSGSWQDAVNWTVDGQPAQTYPHAEDIIGYVDNNLKTLTMTFDSDAEAVKFKNPRTSGSKLIFALNGHTLTLNGSNAGDANVIAVDQGVNATSLDDISCASVVVSNGTLAITQSGICLGYCMNTSSGLLYLEDHATCAAAIKYVNNSSRIYVRGGSELKQGGLSRDLVINHHTANGKYPLLCVTGVNSRVSYPDNTISIRGYGAACYVQQGAQITAKMFNIGGTNFCWGTGTDGIANKIYSLDTHVHVENATLDVRQDLTMGWLNDAQCFPRLVMSGTGTVVTVGGTLKIYGGMAASLEYEMPVEGFAANPLTANALELIAKPAGNTDYGTTSIKLRGIKAWAKANSKKSVNLVTLTEPNPVGLETLKASTTFDWNKMPSSSLSVSADGTALVLTAPAEPGFFMLVR